MRCKNFYASFSEEVFLKSNHHKILFYGNNDEGVKMKDFYIF